MRSCSEIKVQGKEEETGTLVPMVFVFPRNCYTCRYHAFQEVIKTSACQWEAVSKLGFFHLFEHAALASLTKMLLSQFSPCPMGEESERAAVWVYSCWLGSSPLLGTQCGA